MKNGMEQVKIADQPPIPTEMWEIKHYVDPAVGAEIQMAVSPDPLVKPVFKSTVNVMTNRGPATIAFDIQDASTIQEACRLWHAAAKTAVAKAQKHMRDQQRRIVLPGAPTAPFPLKPNGVN